MLIAALCIAAWLLAGSITANFVLFPPKQKWDVEEVLIVIALGPFGLATYALGSLVAYVMKRIGVGAA